MIEKVLPGGDKAHAPGALQGPPAPAVDPANETLVYAPAAAPHSGAPPGDTHPRAGDPTFASPPPDGGTLVPGGPPATATAAAEAVNSAADEPTLGVHAAATLDGGDAATRAYQQSAMASAPRVTTGASFGHYELLSPIAKGGMGIVYKARQRNLNRIVAIKMILDGQFADQTDIDRFYAEAEAAAALSHPNIVAIHEIGEVQGQHFFSMDFIDGQSLADLVRENPLRPRRAAEFVRTIAETMQFAHESGVVHRDLKPANILLDKRQRPLITDFGLAKHVSSQSQRTMAGSIVGTPSYMPPEQAAGRIDEIGPWSDLYSLGAILYELLTGRPPFRSASPFETIRQVLETEPLSPRALNENVPKDLETICLKCLQKERTRRYETAQELADELGRFLRGEPIHARPISRVERFWRLCRRYPIASSAIATAAVFFIAASIVSTVAYITTKAALTETKIAKEESDRSFKELMNTVDELFTLVSEETLLNQPGMQPVREKLLTKAKEAYERFSQQRANDPTVEFELARAFFRLGTVAAMLRSPDEALKPYAKAREIQERLLAQLPNDPRRIEALGDTVNFMGRARASLQDLDEALSDFGEAVKLRARLADIDRANGEYQRVLANTYMNIGLIRGTKQEYASARQDFEEAQRIRHAALDTNPDPELSARLRRDLAQGYFGLATLEMDERHPATAEKHFRRAADLFARLAEENPDDLECQKNLALVDRALGDVLPDIDEARQHYEDARSRLKQLAEQNPKVDEYRTEWAGVLANLFTLELRAERKDAARKALEQAREILARLAAESPAVPRYQSNLADTLRELASLQLAASESGAAIESMHEALRLIRGLVKQHGASFDAAEGMTVRQLGEVYRDSGNHEAAVAHLDEAARLMRRLAEKHADVPHQFELAITLRALASAQQAAGNAKAATATLDETVRILSDLVAKEPNDEEFKQWLQAAKDSLAAAKP
jgi:serine/threonine protein kinase